MSNGPSIPDALRVAAEEANARIAAREAADIAEGRIVVFCGCAFPRGATIPTHPGEAMLFAKDVLHRILEAPSSAEFAAYIAAGYTNRGIIMQMASRAVAKAFNVDHRALLWKYILHYWIPLWEIHDNSNDNEGKGE